MPEFIKPGVNSLDEKSALVYEKKSPPEVPEKPDFQVVRWEKEKDSLKQLIDKVDKKEGQK